MKGAILDWDCYGPDISLAPLENLGVHWEVHSLTKPDQILERLHSKQIAIVNKVPLRKETLSQLPDLQLICEGATGYDNIDIAAANERGIVVCNVPAYSTDSVAQLTLFFVLNLFESAFSYQNTKKEWPHSPMYCRFNGPIVEAKGKTIGIVGAGKIGQEVGRLCHAFGMKVIYTASRDPKRSLPGSLPLEKLLPIADIVTLHVPLTAETRHLFGEKAFSSMKKGAFLINNSRGGLIDEMALVKALKSHHLGGAALDVLSQEPPPHDHPLLDPTIPNLIITPHIAWASIEARTRMIDILASNVSAFLSGKPQNVVLHKIA